MEKLITKKLGTISAVLVAVFCLALLSAACATCRADLYISPEEWDYNEEEQLWYFYYYWDLQFTATEEEKEQRYAEWIAERKAEQDKEEQQNSGEANDPEKPIDPSPKTGDGTMIIIGIAVASVSIIGIAALLCLKKKAT